MELTKRELKMLKKSLSTEIQKRNRQIRRFWKQNTPESDISSGIRELEEYCQEYEELYRKIDNEINTGGHEVW